MITETDPEKREMLYECIGTMTEEAKKLATLGRKAEEIEALSRLTIRALLEGTKRFSTDEIDMVVSSIKIVKRASV